MEKAAFRIHDDVNQKYDHVLPYGFHLKMTVSYVSRYGYPPIVHDSILILSQSVNGLILGRNKALSDFETLFTSGNRTFEVPCLSIPVSYTHLDVYKRQPLHPLNIAEWSSW